MEFSNNSQVINEYKKLVKSKNLTMREVAERLDIKPQQLNNKFNNKHLTLDELKKFLDVVGYSLDVSFISQE